MKTVHLVLPPQQTSHLNWIKAKNPTADQLNMCYVALILRMVELLMMPAGLYKLVRALLPGISDHTTAAKY